VEGNILKCLEGLFGKSGAMRWWKSLFERDEECRPAKGDSKRRSKERRYGVTGREGMAWKRGCGEDQLL
jgi:hypothetical protein